MNDESDDEAFETEQYMLAESGMIQSQIIIPHSKEEYVKFQLSLTEFESPQLLIDVCIRWMCLETSTTFGKVESITINESGKVNSSTQQKR